MNWPFSSLVLIALLSLASLGDTPSKPPSLSPQSLSLGLQYWRTSYDDYFWTVDSKFQNQSHGGYLSLDWPLVTHSIGKLSLGFGTGLGVASNIELTEDVKATLMTVPVDIFASYRLQLFNDQIFVPFIKLGYGWLLNTQTSATGGERVGWRKFQNAFGGIGLDTCLNFFDREQGNRFDAQTGINAVFLTLEFVFAKGVPSQQIVDLTHQDLRVGIRLDI